MKILKNGEIGFEDCFISDQPLPTGASAKPYISLIMPYLTEQDINYFHDQVSFLRKLGIYIVQNKFNKKIFLKITGENKIIPAIDFLLKLPEYQIKENDELFSKLRQLQNECQIRQRVKNACLPKESRIPLKSKSITFFNQGPLNVNTTANVISIIAKKTKPQKQYILKENSTARSISEIEVFNGFCYRLLLGKQHPKVRGIHNAEGKRVGVASERIPDFTSVSDYAKKHGTIGLDKIISSGMIKVWAAAYCEEEVDLHAKNYGFDQYGNCVKIDDDRSTWPQTAKYAGLDPCKVDKFYTTPPVVCFKATAKDIHLFPFLRDAKPYHWLNKNGHDKYFDSGALNELATNSLVDNDKYYMFLKRILIPRTVYESIATATIGSQHTRDKLSNHKCARTDELTNALLREPGFKNYVLTVPHIIEQILQDFTEYNAEFKKPKNAYLHVNIDEVRKNYNALHGLIVRAAISKRT